MIKAIRKVLPILGVLLFLRLMSKLNFTEFVYNLSHVPLEKILVLIFCCWFGLIMKGIRWLIITRFVNVSKIDLLRVFYASMFLGVITPGRLGELSKISFLKDRGIDYSIALYLTIYDRVFDVGYLLIASLFYLSYVYDFNTTLIYSIIVFTLLFIFVQYYVAKRLIIEKIGILSSMICYGITIISYLVFGLGFANLLVLTNNTQVALCTLSITLGNLVALVPISIMGLGTREYVLINVLTFVPSVDIVASSLIHLTTSVLASLLFCSFFYSKSLFTNPKAGELSQ
ncbi:MAG: flippase-like domain-containing protein [Candidatus Cloacimonetes bacterium]|nr:flippase-like domain-containing protein [Candidatus Cloacimonadota bacterium]